jgi:hypothetical protein
MVEFLGDFHFGTPVSRKERRRRYRKFLRLMERRVRDSAGKDVGWSYTGFGDMLHSPNPAKT